MEPTTRSDFRQLRPVIFSNEGATGLFAAKRIVIVRYKSCPARSRLYILCVLRDFILLKEP